MEEAAGEGAFLPYHYPPNSPGKLLQLVREGGSTGSSPFLSPRVPSRLQAEPAATLRPASLQDYSPVPANTHSGGSTQTGTGMGRGEVGGEDGVRGWGRCQPVKEHGLKGDRSRWSTAPAGVCPAGDRPLTLSIAPPRCTPPLPALALSQCQL